MDKMLHDKFQLIEILRVCVKVSDADAELLMCSQSVLK